MQVDLNRLVAYGLTLPQVLQALNNANINVGGNTVNIGAQSAVVRGVGLIRSIDDIRNTMLSQSRRQRRCWSRDVADVTVGDKPRLGIAGQDDDDDIVQGIVLMRRGEQSAADHRPRRRPRSTRSTHPACCRRASGSSASTTART